MIHSVSIQNFKNIRDQTIDLERLTVFVGANASGKTSVLEAIRAVIDESTDVLIQEWDPRKLLDWHYTRGGRGDFSIECTTEGGRLAIKASPPEAFPLDSARMGECVWNRVVLPPNGSEREEAMRATGPFAWYRLNARRLAEPSNPKVNPPCLGFEGDGLASTLVYMSEKDPDSFSDLHDFMRKFNPRFKQIRFRKVVKTWIENEGARPYLRNAILFDFTNADDVAAHTVSEGILLQLGLLAVLLGPSRPRILMLDDLDQGLHPLAQKTLLGVIRTIMERFPDLQILATSHSPYLLDHLQPSEIRLMAVGDDGYAVCGKLKDHPRFERWKDEMATGELWSLFGEQWVARGGAAQ